LIGNLRTEKNKPLSLFHCSAYDKSPNYEIIIQMKKFDPATSYILMVDDTPVNLQVLGKTLKNEGYKVEFSTNGERALDWLKKKDFDLVLLDIMMPEMDGYEVCRIIRKEKRLDDLPIIFLTAKNDKDSIVKAFDAGGQDYITKPFDSSELLARVKTHLELKKSKEQLTTFNKTLEKTVNERTIELKAAYNDLKLANDKLLKLDNAKANFLNIISHEIRTPLNGILGFAELLRANIQSKTLLEYIDYLKNSACRLEEFAQNAMHITSLQTGHYSIQAKKVQLKNIIDTILFKFKSDISNKNIAVSIKYKAEEALCDAELVKICLENIIHNAIVYTPNDSIIKIHTVASNEHISIFIKDEGPGFSEDALKNLFQLFGPGENFVDNNTGLGLALAKLIAEAHMGEINVSNLDNGACVEVILNVQEEV